MVVLVFGVFPTSSPRLRQRRREWPRSTFNDGGSFRTDRRRRRSGYDQEAQAKNFYLSLITGTLEWQRSVISLSITGWSDVPSPRPSLFSTSTVLATLAVNALVALETYLHWKSSGNLIKFSLTTPPHATSMVGYRIEWCSQEAAGMSSDSIKIHIILPQFGAMTTTQKSSFPT